MGAHASPWMALTSRLNSTTCRYSYATLIRVSSTVARTESDGERVQQGRVELSAPQPHCRIARPRIKVMRHLWWVHAPRRLDKSSIAHSYRCPSSSTPSHLSPSSTPQHPSLFVACSCCESISFPLSTFFTTRSASHHHHEVQSPLRAAGACSCLAYLPGRDYPQGRSSSAVLHKRKGGAKLVHDCVQEARQGPPRQGAS